MSNSILKKTRAGGALVGQQNGQTIVHNDGSKGGIFKGKRHSEGGIKGFVEEGKPIEVETDEAQLVPAVMTDTQTHKFNGEQLTTKEIVSEINQGAGGVEIKKEGGTVDDNGGEPIKFQANSVIITRNAVLDKSTQEFDGKKMTNKQILSHINQENGGIAFADGGEIPHSCGCTGKKYNYGGNLMNDYDIVSDITAKYPDAMERGANDEFEEHETAFDMLYAGEITPERAAQMVAADHLKKNPHAYDAGKTPEQSAMENRQAEYQAADSFADGGKVGDLSLTDCQKKFLRKIKESTSGILRVPVSFGKSLIMEPLKQAGLIHTVKIKGMPDLEAYLTKPGKELMATQLFEDGGTCTESYEFGGVASYAKGAALKDSGGSKFKYYRGVDYAYSNPFEVNKAIEELLDSRKDFKSTDFTYEEKVFLKYYSGYGGLEKFGATGSGLLFEYYTPSIIAEKMWGLAYKFGYTGGEWMEPSAGVGEFIQYSPNQHLCDAYEINPYSARICRILYPEANVQNKYFEELFIRNNDTIRDKLNMLKKYDLIIGNPPYGAFGGKWSGMGEASFTKSKNYIDYFITRGLDLLKPNGLLIYIIGAEVAAGGVPFLQQAMNPVKKIIAEKSILLDAYRLPNGVFDRTDVLTDIIVLQKK